MYGFGGTSSASMTTTQRMAIRNPNMLNCILSFSSELAGGQCGWWVHFCLFIGFQKKKKMFLVIIFRTWILIFFLLKTFGCLCLLYSLQNSNVAVVKTSSFLWWLLIIYLTFLLKKKKGINHPNSMTLYDLVVVGLRSLNFWWVYDAPHRGSNLQFSIFCFFVNFYSFVLKIVLGHLRDTFGLLKNNFMKLVAPVILWVSQNLKRPKSPKLPKNHDSKIPYILSTDPKKFLVAEILLKNVLLSFFGNWPIFDNFFFKWPNIPFILVETEHAKKKSIR